MLVEFVGGSLSGQQREISHPFEYVNYYDETYIFKAIKYSLLNWTYIWYEFISIEAH